MVVERYPDEIKVGIADWRVDREPKQLVTLGLGSCVGIALYDASTRIGGLAHIMLPDSSQFQNKTNPAKYADLAIPAMLEEMLKRGAKKSAITAKIARSEEHTSELQSRENVVCRLLLEKKSRAEVSTPDTPQGAMEA